jgi:hypothetical protein
MPKRLPMIWNSPIRRVEDPEKVDWGVDLVNRFKDVCPFSPRLNLKDRLMTLKTSPEVFFGIQMLYLFSLWT